MANWATVNLSQLIPAELTDTTTAVSEVLGTLTTYLATLREALQLVSALAVDSPATALETALREVIDEVQGIVDGLARGTTIHAIFIPIQKRYYYRGVQGTLEQQLGATPSTDFADLVSGGAFSNIDINTLPPEVANFINASSSAIGGNLGFWRELSASTSDTGDVHRPIFPENYATAGVCVLFGATDLASLQPNFNLLTSLIQAGDHAELAAGTRPTVRDLSARVTADVNTVGQMGVALTWNPQVAPTSLRLFTNETMNILEVFILRSDNASLRDKFTWNQVFSRQPRESTGDLQEENDVKVVARIPYNGLLPTYTDNSSDLQQGHSYYYAAAVRYATVNPDDADTTNATVQPMSDLSNCVRVKLKGTPAQGRTGTSPDWQATPNLLGLFPNLTEVVAIIDALFASLRARTVAASSTAQLLTATIAQLDRTITQLQAVVDDLSAVNARLAAVSGGSAAGISATIITLGSGGINGWLGELARRLSDTSDDTRPAFDNGELVAGVVFLCGAPGIEQLAATVSLLEAFFGSSESSTLLAAIDSVEAIAAPATTISFDGTMAATRNTEAAAAEDAAAAATVTPTSGTVFDESLQPTNVRTC
jgi:hypothetical protein